MWHSSFFALGRTVRSARSWTGKSPRAGIAMTTARERRLGSLNFNLGLL